MDKTFFSCDAVSNIFPQRIIDTVIVINFLLCKFSLGLFQFVFNLILLKKRTVLVQRTTSMTSNFMIRIYLFQKFTISLPIREQTTFDLYNLYRSMHA